MGTLLDRPDTIFEVNFFDTMDGQSWTNLSDYVELQEGISISKRRTVIFDEVSGGTLALSLDNSAGTFNNLRDDLPYFGLIDIDVPVRFRARWPNVPTGTINMLTDDQSQANDDDFFAIEQGTSDLELVDVPAGQDSALIWNTGVLATVDNRVITGDFNSRSADTDIPMYVKATTQYTGSVKVKCDTAGTGITFKVSARILWYDSKGQFISESKGTSTTLTTSYQSVTVTATSPGTAYSARLAIGNDVLVSPATATIALTGFTNDAVNKGGKSTHLTLQKELSVGDLALVWLHSNQQPTFSPPDGTWTSIDTWTDSRGKTATYYKFLTQADIGAITEWKVNQSGNHWLALMSSYSGVNKSTPINAHVTSTETLFQTGHTTAAITTTVANCWIVSGVFDTSSTTTVWTPPGTVTARQARYCTGGNAATGLIADTNAPVTAGAKTGEAFSANVKSKFAAMGRVALAPATGTGPGSVEVLMGAWQFEQSATASAWVSGGHWQDMFTGLADSWSKTWSGDLAVTQLQATDRSKQLANNNVGAAVTETILQAGPVAYYILGESGDTSTTQGANTSTQTQGSLNVVQVGTGGELDWGQGVGPPVDGSAAVQIIKSNINNGQVLRATLNNPIKSAGEITLMGWFNSADADASSTLTLFKATPTNSGGTELAYTEIRGTSGTNMQANSAVKSEVTPYITTATDAHNYFNGKTHFAAATFTLDGGNLVATLYIDGVQTAQNSLACPFTEFPDITTLDIAHAFPTNHLCSGTYSHVALFDYAVDPDTIDDIFMAGSTAFAGETVDQRISRVADWAGIDDVDLDPSTTICDRHMPDSTPVLQVIQQAARTDGGTSFIGDDGDINFFSRARKEGTNSVWLTVDARLVDPGLSEVTDDQLLVNQANIVRLGANTTQTSINLSSQLAHGVYDKNVETIQQDIDDATYNGEYLTAFYAEPVQRCDTVTLNALFLNQWAVLLTQDMWNILQITGLPAIEETSSLQLFIEGWAYQIDDQTWTITYDTSQAIPFAILNDSARGVTGNVVVAW